MAGEAIASKSKPQLRLALLEQLLVEEKDNCVWSFECFTPEFCR
jgi:hypothetical protein